MASGGFGALSGRNLLKPLNGLDFEKEDICEVIFSHKKTVKACRLFLDWLKNNRNEASRAQVSSFARELAGGHIREGFTYKRSNFYRTLLKKLVALGFISLQSRFDPESNRKARYVYALIRQPIPKRPPLGGSSFWRRAWDLCNNWNKEFYGKGT